MKTRKYKERRIATKEFRELCESEERRKKQEEEEIRKASNNNKIKMET